MLPPISPLTALQNALRDGLSPVAIAQDCTAKANGNASRNTYTDFDRRGPRGSGRRSAARTPALRYPDLAEGLIRSGRHEDHCRESFFTPI